ncbi:unnamed protein product, partial [Gulo gulo]
RALLGSTVSPPAPTGSLLGKRQPHPPGEGTALPAANPGNAAPSKCAWAECPHCRLNPTPGLSAPS